MQKPKMKIAVVCELAGTKRHGGAEHAILSVAKELAKIAIVDTYSYAPSGNQKKIKTHFPARIRVAPVIRDMLVMPFVGKKLLRELQNKYTVIIAYAPTIAAFFKPSAQMVIICHGVRSQKFDRMNKIRKYKILFNPIIYRIMAWLEGRSFRNADKIVVIRDHHKEFIERHFGTRPDITKVIPNGVDIDLFKPREAQKKNQIIFVGRTTLPKGFFVLMKAAPHINANILVVTQKTNDHALDVAKSIGNVEIIKNATHEQLSGLYTESKFLVLPSYDEEQPLTVLEAMACALPVVVSKVAAANVVKDNMNGYVLQHIDPDALAEACNKLLALPEEVEKIGKLNRKIVEAEYSNSFIRIADHIGLLKGNKALGS